MASRNILDDYHPNLRFCSFLKILGFSKNEYTNNNTYTTDTHQQFNWLDTIYIKTKINKYTTNVNFEYTSSFNYNSTKTFNEYNKIALNEDIHVNANDFMSFYIKTKNGFKKLTEKLSFDFILIYV